MTVTEYIRSRIEPVTDPPKLSGASYEELVRDEEDGFCDKMDARLVMGRMRYRKGKLQQTSSKRMHYMERMAQKIELYKKTGNTELLVDIANYARLEFRDPEHEKAHFTPLDRI